MVHLQTAIAEEEGENDRPTDALPEVEDLAHCGEYLRTDIKRPDYRQQIERCFQAPCRGAYSILGAGFAL